MLRLILLTLLGVVGLASGQQGLKLPAKANPTEMMNSCSSVAGLEQLAKSSGAKDPAAVGNAAWLFIYGYPILAMAASAVTSSGGVPVNNWSTSKALIQPPEDAKLGVVTTNTDTLYNIAWLDLSKGPVVISAPAMVPASRFYVLPLLDMYNNQFASFGSVTTGNKAGSWLITPPGFKGPLPTQFSKLPRTSAPTMGVWVVGRMYVSSQSDLPNVLNLWGQFKIQPVNPGQGKPTMLTSTTTTAYNIMGKPSPADIGKANTTAAFVALAGLSQAFPPPANELVNLTKAARAVNLDLVKGFDQARVSKAQADAHTAGYELAMKCIDNNLEHFWGKSFKYGWSATASDGQYGTQYLLRAATALQGLGALSNNIATYYNNDKDSSGKPLTGANGTVYTITFPGAPPSNFFSSLTLYQSSNKFMVYPNPIKRPSIQVPRDARGLAANKDGTVTIYISAAAPGPKGSLAYTNWLPSGPYPVYLILRVYGPKPAVYPNLTYQPPPFIKIKG